MKYCIILLSFFMVSVVSAQDLETEIRPEVRQKIEKYRVGYFTTALNLTDKEASVFWPIYNKYSEVKMALFRSSKPPRPDELTGKSEAEINRLLDNYIAQKEQLLNAEKTMLTSLKGKLPAHKILSIPRVQRNFLKEMLQKIREQKH